MASFPTDFASYSTVIQKGLGPRGDEAIDFLASKGFVVLDGFTEKLAEEVMEIAKQPHIKEYCPRDCMPERFGSIEATKQWLGKGHAMFILAKDLGNENYQAVGYGWTGPKTTPEIPGGKTTFALRIGEVGVGQKLAVPFSQVILSATKQIYGGEHFWLETWASNGAGVHTYKKLGFVEVSTKPGQRPTASGELVDDERVYMSLPDDLLA